MSNKAERQLRELRSLMPWTWDNRVEEHPPGEKAMHDFENVLTYQLDHRRRRGPRPPSPAKPPTKRQSAAAVALPGEGAAATVAAAVPAHDGLEGCVSIETSEKEGGDDAARRAAVAKEEDSEVEEDEEKDITIVKEPVQGEGANAGTAPGSPVAAMAPSTGNILPTAAPTAGLPPLPMSTPAAHLKAAQNPSSRPSSSGQRFVPAALSDAQFQPTPASVMRTFTLTKPAAGGAGADGFRSPAPRTIFAQKKRPAPASASEEEKEKKDAKAGGASTMTVEDAATVIADLQTSVAAVATAVRTREGPPAATKAAAAAAVVLPLPVGPPVPVPKTKGPRSVSLPLKRPVDLSFLQGGSEDASAPAASKQQHKRVRIAPPSAPESAKRQAVLPPRPPRQQHINQQQQRAALSSDAPLSELPLNLAKFGSGPVLRRPVTCPPLFKFSPVAPAPPPSAQKMRQAETLGAKFFLNEKKTLAMLSAGTLAAQRMAATKKMSAAITSSGGCGTFSHPAAVAMQGAMAQQAIGPTLRWACGKLQQQV